MKHKIRKASIYTIEEFIRDTVPEKRKAYAKVLQDFDKLNVTTMKYELLVKTDEH